MPGGEINIDREHWREEFYVPDEFAIERVDLTRYDEEKDDRLSPAQIRGSATGIMRVIDAGKEEGHYASDILVIFDGIAFGAGRKKGPLCIPVDKHGVLSEERLRVFVNNSGLWLDGEEERGYFKAPPETGGELIEDLARVLKTRGRG